LTSPVGRTFSSAYLADEPAARLFLARDFEDADARRAVVRAAAMRRASPTLVEVLREQQARLPVDSSRDASLAALARGDTAVVATGQQVGLFLGPLYSFYKAATAVAAARAIEAESGARTVPLFWLQTEDHDFAEIAACHVAGPDGTPVTLALAPEAPGEARVSVAHRRLGPEVAGLVEALGEALGDDARRDEVVALVRAHYVPGRPLAQAFAGLLAAVFAGDGLLVLDPRDARVAGLAAPLYAHAVADAAPIEAALRARGAALAAAGFDAQIPVREACSLLFFHERDATGPRFRLQRSPGAAAWTLAGTGATVADAELERCLARDPLRFSTSALLRPLVQDALLPTAAYVGGPAELSYFAQLGPLYEHFALPAPLVVPRARFRILDVATRRRLEQLGLSADDAAAPRATLLARLATARPGAPTTESLRRIVAERIAPAVDDVTRAAAASDAGLARAAARTRAAVDRALGRFVARYARDVSAHDGVTGARLDKVQHALLPSGVPQERYFGWPSPAARLGAGTLKRLVFERLAAAPFSTAPQDLTP
jgi:bacillithiol biosynthesis cysteine-adding enzyme BshC